MMDYNERNDELYHHGIIGQKWGSRNGPPYPLNSKVSKQIKKGNNPKYKKDEEYRKEREKLKSGENVDTEGMALFRKRRKKKKGLFSKKKKVSNLPQEYQNVQKVQEILDADAKFLDSRKYSSKDLKELTSRFRDEADYNDALARRYETENRLLNNHEVRMSRKDRKKYEKMIRKMETETAYNRMIQQQIDSQINLIRSQQTLNQLTAKPKKQSAIKRGSKAVAGYLGDIAKMGLYNVGGQATTILFSEMLNRGLNNYYNKSSKHSNYTPDQLSSPMINASSGKKSNKK